VLLRGRLAAALGRYITKKGSIVTLVAGIAPVKSLNNILMVTENIPLANKHRIGDNTPWHERSGQVRNTPACIMPARRAA
jgi:hypothetical protein